MFTIDTRQPTTNINNLNITTMNKQRLKRLEEIVAGLVDSRDDLEVIRDEEQECFDNMPEGFQCSERGERMEENASALDGAYDDLDTLIDNIQDIIDNN